MKKTVPIIFVLFLFVACNPLRHSSNNSNSHVKIHINDSIKIGEPILFGVENINSEPITIYYPERLWIEKLEDKWNKLKILECLCDAPCQASEDKIVLESGKQLTLRWDQKESWCRSRTTGQIRETIFKSAEEGKYRIVINYRSSEGEESSFSREFQITERVFQKHLNYFNSNNLLLNQIRKK